VDFARASNSGRCRVVIRMSTTSRAAGQEFCAPRLTLWPVLLGVMLGGLAASGSDRAVSADPATNPATVDARTSPAIGGRRPMTRLVGQLGGSTRAIAVSGGYAYVGVGSRVLVFDVSSPDQPRQVGPSAPLPGVVRDIVVRGRHAFVAVGGGGLCVIDVSRADAPRLVGRSPTRGASLALVMAGHFAYLAEGRAGLRVVDVSSPANPREVRAETLDRNGIATRLTVAGRNLYVAGEDLGLSIYDLTVARTPRRVGWVSAGGS